MSSMDLVRELAASEQGLCVVATTRPDGSVHASVVNAGPMAHPVSGADVVAFVARGGASKVGLVRATGRVSITFRRQWQWAGVEGAAEIVDADDPERGIVLAELLRTIFRAAGGIHDDWDEFDRVMAAEARVGVLVTPERVLGNR